MNILNLKFLGVLTLMVLSLFGCAEETKPSGDLTEDQLSRARARLTVSTGGQECGALVTADWEDMAKSQCKEYSRVPTYRPWCETHINTFLAKYPKVDCFYYSLGRREPLHRVILKADELREAQLKMAGYRICDGNEFCPSHIFRKYQLLPNYCHENTDIFVLSDEEMISCHSALKDLIDTARSHYRQFPPQINACVMPSFADETCERISFTRLDGLRSRMSLNVPQTD